VIDGEGAIKLNSPPPEKAIECIRRFAPPLGQIKMDGSPPIRIDENYGLFVICYLLFVICYLLFYERHLKNLV